MQTIRYLTGSGDRPDRGPGSRGEDHRWSRSPGHGSSGPESRLPGGAGGDREDDRVSRGPGDPGNRGEDRVGNHGEGRGGDHGEDGGGDHGESRGGDRPGDGVVKLPSVAANPCGTGT